eukprot:3173916-Prymnesium_polylepis.1
MCQSYSVLLVLAASDGGFTVTACTSVASAIEASKIAWPPRSLKPLLHRMPSAYGTRAASTKITVAGSVKVTCAALGSAIATKVPVAKIQALV